MRRLFAVCTLFSAKIRLLIENNCQIPVYSTYTRMKKTVKIIYLCPINPCRRGLRCKSKVCENSGSEIRTGQFSESPENFMMQQPRMKKINSGLQEVRKPNIVSFTPTELMQEDVLSDKEKPERMVFGRK